MPATRCYSTLRLVNGSTGDPVLYVDSPGKDNALLFDAGDNAALSMQELGDLDAVFISHHHVDHFIGLDRIVRANLDRDKTLQIFGPAGTIRKVYDRIKSYEYPFFPFQKIVIRVHDVLSKSICSALLECTRRFPEPEIVEAPRTGNVIYETSSIVVETTPVDHTVPCLAYALLEKPGWHVQADKLASSGLRPGPWTQAAIHRARAGESLETSFKTPQGQELTLKEFLELCCVNSPGGRVAFVTDTAWNDSVKPGLLQLATGAWRLYCDCFYSVEQAKSAETYHHMTTRCVAEFAAAAQVEQLVLIHFSTRYVSDYQRLIDEVREGFPNVTAEIP